MPFTCIQGTFHLVGHDKNGKPTGFEPDGDSIHFKPKKIALLDGLTQLGVKYKPSAIGSVNLRMEGIDALEIHYTPSFKGAKRTHQPRPLADYERDALTGLLGMNPVPYKQPLGTTVAPPVPVDGVPGYILSRSLDVHGRPVSFLYKGAAPFTDGKQVMVRSPQAPVPTAATGPSSANREANNGRCRAVHIRSAPASCGRVAVLSGDASRGSRLRIPPGSQMT